MPGVNRWNAALRAIRGGLVALAMLGIGACSTGSGYGDDAPDTNWAFHGNDRAETRFSPLTQINADNVGDLGLAWTLDLPDENSLQATPLAVDGVLYFSGGLSKVYAVDAVSGKMLWSYDPKVGEVAPSKMRVIFSVNRGVAYWQGMVYVATKDGRMVALDARTGKPVWIKPFLRPQDGAASTGAPRVLDGKVMIGNSGAEMGARGYVTAMDARTGDIAWRFFTVPGNPAVDKDETTQLAAKTWSGEWWKYGGGGTVWSGITYDDELGQVYIGTGNGAPYNQDFRCKDGEDNLFLSSVVALDANTGKYKWHYQYNPCEVWDWKATSDMVLATLKLEGKPRKVLMQAPSNGFFYVIDRTTGKLISAEKMGKANWAERIDLKTGRPVELPGIRYTAAEGRVMYPGAYGAHNWQPSSYDSKTGLIYMPYMQLGMKYTKTDAADMTDRKGQLTTRLGVAIEGHLDPKDPMDARGSLLAIDPVTQKMKWRYDHDTMWNAGLVSTAGDLVFQGTSTGQFMAFDARSGRKLWTFDAKLGIVAPPITFAKGGKQYVTILVGPGGTTGEGTLPEFARAGFKYGVHPRRVLTFVLGGRARLPATPKPGLDSDMPELPPAKLTEAQVMAGAAIYHRDCYFCHGIGAASTGGAPDLRHSLIALNQEALGILLRTGPLAERGMPRFDDVKDEEVTSLYQYIRSEADKIAKKPKGG